MRCGWDGSHSSGVVETIHVIIFHPTFYDIFSSNRGVNASFLHSVNTRNNRWQNFVRAPITHMLLVPWPYLAFPYWHCHHCLLTAESLMISESRTPPETFRRRGTLRCGSGALASLPLLSLRCGILAPWAWLHGIQRPKLIP